MKAPVKLPRSVKLKHLTGAVAMKSPTGNSMCFHRAAGLCLDLPGAEVVIGTFRAATAEEAAAYAARGKVASNEPFLHVWVEWKGWVLSPTTLEQTGMQLAPMKPAGYYAVNGATNLKRLPRPELLRIAKATGLSAHLRRGAPLKASFVRAMLDAVGQPFAISEDGGMVPLVETTDG